MPPLEMGYPQHSRGAPKSTQTGDFVPAGEPASTNVQPLTESPRSGTGQAPAGSFGGEGGLAAKKNSLITDSGTYDDWAAQSREPQL